MPCNAQGFTVIEWLWEYVSHGCHGFHETEKKLLELGAEPYSSHTLTDDASKIELNALIRHNIDIFGEDDDDD